MIIPDKSEEGSKELREFDRAVDARILEKYRREPMRLRPRRPS
jgi:hypothetical protein